MLNKKIDIWDIRKAGAKAMASAKLQELIDSCPCADDEELRYLQILKDEVESRKQKAGLN